MFQVKRQSQRPFETGVYNLVEEFKTKEEAVKFAQEYARQIIKIEEIKEVVDTCYNCHKELPLKEYTIRHNYSNKKIMCCSQQCAYEAQCGSEG